MYSALVDISFYCLESFAESFAQTQLLNGMRYALTMLLAPLRIHRMRRRIQHIQTCFGLASDDGDEESDESPHVNLRPLSAAQMYEAIDNAMPEYEQQWADGIVAGATSAAYMLLIMKLVTAPGQEEWSTARVAEVAMILSRCGEESKDGEQVSTQVTYIVTAYCGDIYCDYILWRHAL
jgi:hypothetical protein